MHSVISMILKTIYHFQAENNAIFHVDQHTQVAGASPYHIIHAYIHDRYNEFSVQVILSCCMILALLLIMFQSTRLLSFCKLRKQSQNSTILKPCLHWYGLDSSHIVCFCVSKVHVRIFVCSVCSAHACVCTCVCVCLVSAWCVCVCPRLWPL